MKITNLLKVILSSFLYYTGISQIILSILVRIKPTNFIFAYHRVNNDTNGLFPGDNVAIFKKQIKFLNKCFKIITLSEFINLNEYSKNSYAIITFDDGYKSVYTRALPILKESGISATVFLTTGAIDNNDVIWTDKVNLIREINESMHREIKNRLKSITNAAKNKELSDLLLKYKVDLSSIPDSEKMLSWEEVRSMAKEGIDFGTHTISHPILSKVDREEAEREIVGSKRRVESIIGKPVTTFCYPNGQPEDFDESTKQILKQNGFECAVTAIEGKVENDDDYFALRRISLANRTPSLAILKIIKLLFKDV